MITISVEENIIPTKKEKQKRMNKRYEAKELKYEYSNYNGEYRFVIYTPLTEEELLEKYSEELKKYEPYCIASGEVFKEYVSLTQWEDRVRKNKANHEAIWGYEEAVSECINAELQDKEEAPSELVVALCDAKERVEKCKRVVEALEILTPTQRRRIIARFYDRKSSRTIAKEEGVNYSKVDKSIKAALEKLRKFFE